MPTANKPKTQDANGAPPAADGPPPIILPGELSPITMDPINTTEFIYAAEGVGKTTYAVEKDREHTLLLLCGQDADHIEAYKQVIEDWLHFRRVCATLAEGNHTFTHFAVDVVDNLYRMCFDHMCEKLEIKHPGLVEDFGQSWGVIGDEFKLRVAKLATLGGVTFISHAKDIEVDALSGVGKTTRTVPSLAGAPGRWLAQFVAFEFYAAVERDEDGEDHRVLRTLPSSRWAAKQRIPLGCPKLPDPLPLDAAAVREAMRDSFSHVPTAAQAKANEEEIVAKAQAELGATEA